MHSQSHSTFHAPDKPTANCRLQLNAASSCHAGTAFPIPLQGYQLMRRLGWIDLWKQVENEETSVDFTRVGAFQQDCSTISR
jgi:hypothetical protein